MKLLPTIIVKAGRGGLLPVCFFLLFSVSETFGVTGQKITVSPIAKSSWTELEKIERSQPPAGALQQAPTTIPYMKLLPPRKLGRSIDFTPGKSTVPPDATITPQSIVRFASPTVILNFMAFPDNFTVIPPDTEGAVGPYHVMTMLNAAVRVQSRIGDTISTIGLGTFWSPTGSSGTFDPRLLYDQDSGRWIATSVAARRTAAAAILFAISDTDDPTGTWTYYAFDADPTDSNWADFPDIGFNQIWYALTTNMFSISGDTFKGAAMWVIDKNSALAGGSLTLTTFAPGFDLSGGISGQAIRVCQTFGPEPVLYLADNSGWRNNGVFLLRLSQITGGGPSPVWSVVPGSLDPETGLFAVNNNFNGVQIGASQPGTSTRISTGDFRLIDAVYRNGRIWTTHTGGLPVSSTANRTAVFWYELEPLDMPYPIVQSGVLDGGAGVHYYYPSITANANNDAFMGFTHSDSATYAQAVYTGRMATDPSNAMGDIRVLKLGEATYLKDYGTGVVRWGDYSATVVDPLDDLSFWTIQEYAMEDVGTSANNDRWGTWWGRAAIGQTCCGLYTGGFTGNTDCDTLGVRDLSDITTLIDRIYISQAPLCCEANGNTSGGPPGELSLTDITKLIGYIYITHIETAPCP